MTEEIKTIEQVEASRLDWYLKNAPEAILETRSRVIAVCSRCENEVDLKHPCLSGWELEVSSNIDMDEYCCPHCKAVGSNKRSTIQPGKFAHSVYTVTRYRYDIGAIAHKRYRVEEFVVRREPIKGIFGRIKEYKEDVIRRKVVLFTK